MKGVSNLNPDPNLDKPNPTRTWPIIQTSQEVKGGPINEKTSLWTKEPVGVVRLGFRVDSLSLLVNLGYERALADLWRIYGGSTADLRRIYDGSMTDLSFLTNLSNLC